MWKIDIDELNNLNHLVERLYEKKALLEKGRPLPNSALQRIKEDITVEWTYNSNSIEGNTLSLRETKMVLEEGITVKGKSLREHFEVYNHKKAIDYLQTLVNANYKMTGGDILSLHGFVMRSIEDEFAGRIRNGGVRIIGANFIPPNAAKVSGLFDELINFTNTNPHKFNDILLATIFHHRFVWIHPFFDGNGRTVRLAMNLLLMRKGFPPAVILKNDRAKYYDALNQANKGGYKKLCLLMIQSLERSLNIYLNALPGSNYYYEPISNILEEEQMPYAQEYISLLARQGKIDAHKEGRNWVTTKSAINNYLVGRQRIHKKK